VTVVDITEPTAGRLGIELIDQDAVQLQSKPLRARRVIVRLRTATVLFHSTNLRMRTNTTIHSGLLAYATFGPQATGTVNGLSVRSGLMLALAPEARATLVVDPGWESITFFIPPQDLRAHLTARERGNEFRLPQNVEALSASDAKVRGLFNWGKRLVDTAARQPDLFSGRENEQAGAQVDLLENLLAVLKVASDIEPTRGEQKQTAYSAIVTAAESLALSHTLDRLYVTDLCKAAAVSERTLEYAFKKVMGMTPLAYLTQIRLHRVRQALLEKTRGSTTVSAEAFKWGFWHFGEFSRAYKLCFGELPSDTLQRSPLQTSDH
jgi:AraC family ethanolamine operon transcriptional activator